MTVTTISTTGELAFSREQEELKIETTWAPHRGAHSMISLGCHYLFNAFTHRRERSVLASFPSSAVLPLLLTNVFIWWMYGIRTHHLDSRVSTRLILRVIDWETLQSLIISIISHNAGHLMQEASSRVECQTINASSITICVSPSPFNSPQVSEPQTSEKAVAFIN